MRDLLVFHLISWIALPSVMFGGYSFLVLLPGKLTAQQQTFFRAGHAHAGLLLILSLAYYYYLGLTSLALNTQYLACTVLVGGIFLQSGGFFWHAFLDAGGTRKTGIGITSLGALLLVIAIAILAYGLIIAHT